MKLTSSANPPHVSICLLFLSSLHCPLHQSDAENFLVLPSQQLDRDDPTEAMEDFREAAVEGGAGARDRRPLDQATERTLAAD